MKLNGSRIRFIFLLFSLMLAGCISVKRTRVIPQDQRLLPAKTATKEDLLQALQDKSKQVHTLKGSVTLDFSGGGSKSGVLTEYRQTTGYILVDRPQNIRIKVLAPIVASTVFDMVSDGHQYRVSIPIKNQFAVGDVDAPLNAKSPIANLRPQHLLDALFVDISSYIEKTPQQVKFLFNEQIEGRRSFYVFTFIDVSGDGQRGSNPRKSSGLTATMTSRCPGSRYSGRTAESKRMLNIRIITVKGACGSPKRS